MPEPKTMSYDVTRALREQILALENLFETLNEAVDLPDEAIPRLEDLVRKSDVLSEKLTDYIEERVPPEEWARAKAEVAEWEAGGSKT